MSTISWPNSQAAGNFASLGQGFPELSFLDATRMIAHAALVHGISLVMQYGGILALASFMVFGPERAVLPAASGKIKETA